VLGMKRYKNKFGTKLCDNKMTFQDCELAILRHAVDLSEKIQRQKKAMSEEIKEIMKILEKFLTDKQRICYGGTAINNILPKYAQFYNREIDIPDYDFFSPNALNDAKELADIYNKHGYSEVEAKAGMHFGTFKVYVNFIPIADITYMDKPIYQSLYKESLTIGGIKYASPNFLRMSMYLELSRPNGDVSRWEKVFKRLTLLNEHYPFISEDLKCDKVEFQRHLDQNSELSEKMYFTILDSFINEGVVFFGGYAIRMYSKYMPEKYRKIIEKNPDFDVLSENPEQTANRVKDNLVENGFKRVHIIHNDEVGEIIPSHYEIRVGKDTVACIYSPIACHNYNTINVDNKVIHVATIDTMLSFYIAFTFSEKYSLFRERILCMAKFLFEVEEKNRLEQRGLLKRFSMNCIGTQPTLEDIRSEKSKKFKELKKDSEEYEMWFLKYNPAKNKKRNTYKVSRKFSVPKTKTKTNKTIKRPSTDTPTFTLFPSWVFKDIAVNDRA
jgi:hypothetical protein